MKNLRGILISVGVILIVLSVVILGATVWEVFGDAGKRIRVTVPGFHELNLDEAGLYGGIYLQQGKGRIPVKKLAQMNVRIMDKQTFAEVPIITNTIGQTFDRMGMKGMPLFNFYIDEPGAYTLSALFMGNDPEFSVPIFIVSQAAASVKQTLVVGGLAFLLFLAMGIFILIKLKTWAPK